MRVTVRLFARARDLVGTETVGVDVPEEATVGDLRRRLVAEHPRLMGLSQHLLVAVRTDYVTDDALLADGDEVAMFPPVSGG